ncbi:hypothetical protein TRAPUB_6196 [Trametes pubescens]|uniref:Uncharacterized protein n=1 Tax=Trametes pubescens TaxID=154538 RepID=A0A1M2V6M2_TRAPU|nr:hypothetical protein TRAPUB_6196 [Trametes pubescens]
MFSFDSRANSPSRSSCSHDVSCSDIVHIGCSSGPIDSAKRLAVLANTIEPPPAELSSAPGTVCHVPGASLLETCPVCCASSARRFAGKRETKIEVGDIAFEGDSL